MDDPLAVRVLEGVEEISADPARVRQRAVRDGIDMVTERGPVHERHCVVHHPVRLTPVQQLRDVRVIQAGENRDLLEKSVGRHGHGERGVQNLERDGVSGRIRRKEHAGGTTTSDLTIDLEAPVELLTNQRQKIASNETLPAKVVVPPNRNPGNMAC